MHINCKGNLIDLSQPKVMGILNLTPDSFFDGGKLNSDLDVINQVTKMLADGATFIDIGAYSSKPNASFVSEAEEWKRIESTFQAILNEFPQTIISIDTFRSTIAKRAIENGATLVNDISAGNLDTAMMETVASLHVPYIMMHLRGTPQTMASLTNYDDIVKEVLFYFSEKMSQARLLGIHDIIIDPGFGFAKTTEQNYEVLQKFELFSMLDVPVLAGVSRKSMIYKPLQSSPQEALNGTTALHMVALQKGAKILRVHDVKEAVECVKLYNLLTL